MALRSGTVFAGYRIERTLGAGGMGVVYLARHPRLPRSVALKVLDSEVGADPEFRVRFEREAELAVQLDHPNIVEIYDRGRERDELWISMRYVPGSDVSHLLSAGALPPRRVAGILEQAAAGLDAAHRRGLLHRDVKPANLLVGTDSDGADHVFVTDFGIARSRDDSTALTAAGELVATLGYVAPEQIRGEPLDHRADIYALGVTLYQMLTGALPFARSTPAAVLHAHLSEPPPRPSAVDPSLPPALDQVVATAMAKYPDQRYDTCRALAAAVAAALTPPAAPAPFRSESGRSTMSEPTASNPGAAGRFTPGSHGPAPSAPIRVESNPPVPQQHASGWSGANRPESSPSAPITSVPPSLPVADGGPARSVPPARRSRRVVTTLAAVAVLSVAAIATAFALAGPKSLSGNGIPAESAEPTTTTTTASTTATTTTPAAPTVTAWGRNNDLVALFPGLLPTTPTDTGYQGARCTDLNVLNNGGAPALECVQDNGIHFYVWSFRRGDPRREETFRTNIDNETTRESPWTRPSGSGGVRHSYYPGGNTGLLTVTFDDPARALVVIDVGWDHHTGQELYDRWWTTAPL